MNTVVVWVLVVILQGSGSSSSRAPVVIDNIASRENCIGLGEALKRKHGLQWDEPYSCTAVRKVVAHG